MTAPKKRSTAEWTTLLLSSAVLLMVMALIGVQMREPRTPAAPVATATATRHVGSYFHVDVTLNNEGDQTAANVQVTAELVVGGETRSSDQTVDFLAGSERVDLIFVFKEDPAGGELSVTVSGFAAP